MDFGCAASQSARALESRRQLKRRCVMGLRTAHSCLCHSGRLSRLEHNIVDQARGPDISGNHDQSGLRDVVDGLERFWINDLEIVEAHLRFIGNYFSSRLAQLGNTTLPGMKFAFRGLQRTTQNKRVRPLFSAEVNVA